MNQGVTAVDLIVVIIEGAKQSLRSILVKRNVYKSQLLDPPKNCP